VVFSQHHSTKTSGGFPYFRRENNCFPVIFALWLNHFGGFFGLRTKRSGLQGYAHHLSAALRKLKMKSTIYNIKTQ
jgi:hypothetical protein